MHGLYWVLSERHNISADGGIVSPSQFYCHLLTVTYIFTMEYLLESSTWILIDNKPKHFDSAGYEEIVKEYNSRIKETLSQKALPQSTLNMYDRIKSRRRRKGYTYRRTSPKAKFW